MYVLINLLPTYFCLISCIFCVFFSIHTPVVFLLFLTSKDSTSIGFSSGAQVSGQVTSSGFAAPPNMTPLGPKVLRLSSEHHETFAAKRKIVFFLNTEYPAESD